MELRHSPRINVTWRGGIRLREQIFPIKVINISNSGLLFLCTHPIQVERDYQMMIEIPNIDHDIKTLYKVPCKVLIKHAILSDDFFKVGSRFVEISSMHKDLVAAWVSLVKKFDPQ